MNVLLITGGKSSEHDVARNSCTTIKKMIDHNRYTVSVAGIDHDGIWYELNDKITNYTMDNWLFDAKIIDNVNTYLQKFDVVFPVLHGKYGEDGTLQALFELNNIPYVGCKVLPSAIAMDKHISKQLVSSLGIKTVPYLVVKKDSHGNFYIIDNELNESTDVVNTIKQKIGFPCFIKAVNSGSSVGCYKVINELDVLTKIRSAAKYDTKILVEKAVDAIELECALIGNHDVIASRVGQVIPHGDFYSFESKYLDSKSKSIIPADIPFSVENMIREYSIKIFKAIDGSGMSRCDFFLDKNTGDIYFNEINTIPGFTDISMYPLLLEDIGFTSYDIIDELISLALEK